MKTFIQRGDVLDVVLSSDATSGDVIVQGKLIGIANTSGKAGETIAVTVEGVVAVPKAGATVFSTGVAVAWAGGLAVSGAGASLGYAAAAAGSGVTSVWVKLTPSVA